MQLQHGSQSSPEPRATVASYRVSHVLMHEKPFKDGDILKEALTEAGNSLFEQFKTREQIVKAIKEVELSCNTIQGMRKRGYVCRGATEEFIDACECLFLHFEESIDMWHNCVVSSGGLGRQHDRQRRSTHLFARTYQKREYF